MYTKYHVLGEHVYDRAKEKSAPTCCALAAGDIGPVCVWGPVPTYRCTILSTQSRSVC